MDVEGETEQRQPSQPWPVLLTLTGLALLVFPLEDLLRETHSGLDLLVAVALPVALSLSVVGGGYWLSRSDIDPDYHAEVGVRTLAAMAAVGVLTAVAVGHSSVHDASIPELVPLLSLLLPLGAFVGMLAGVPAARTRQQADLLAGRESRFQTIVENIDEVVWMLSPTLDSVEYVSPGFGRIFGDADVDDLSLEGLETVHPDDRDALRSVLTALDRDRERGEFRPEYTGEFRVRSGGGTDGDGVADGGRDGDGVADGGRDGDGGRERSDVADASASADGLRWVSFSMHPVTDADGRLQKVVGLTTDVTDQKSRERRLESQTHQLALLNRLVRHDIRNDMSVINGWLEVVRDDVPADLSGTFERISRRSQHTIALTESVGDAVDVIESDASVSRTPVDLGATLWDEVVKLRESHPEATVVVPDSLPSVEVLANGMLSSVFGNVLFNAVVHNDRESPVVTVDVDVGTETVTVSVADDGPGIPPGIRDSVFDAGERGSKSSGTGIGLYLVDNLVEAYGGSVTVADNEPRGTVFTITLPRA